MTDLATVRAICGHLRDNFRYSRLDELEPHVALARLVNERRGCCLQFAQAAAIMLRSRGVPTRIVTGFLVREWVPTRSLYVARGSDYHAWIEVKFERCGWVPFDPTPLSTGDNAEELPDALAAGAAIDEEDRLAQAISGAATAVRDAAAFVRSHPWEAIAVAVALNVAFLLLRRSRRSRLWRRWRLSQLWRLWRGVRSESADAADVRSPAWERLIDELAARGLRRGSAETALEFAHRAVSALGASLAPMIQLTARQQAARFGRIALTTDDETGIDRLRGSL